MMENKKELEELKQYCYDYIKRKYGERQNYIKKTRITKYGLFIYGHKVYTPGYNMIYTINTFINFYDSNNYNFINDMLDNFVLDCQRLNEYKSNKNIEI